MRPPAHWPPAPVPSTPPGQDRIEQALREVRQRRRRHAAVTAAAAAAVALAAVGLVQPWPTGRDRLDVATTPSPSASQPAPAQPKLVVNPADGLQDRQQVRVTLRGFPANVTVWISQCSNVKAVNPDGCGQPLHSQQSVVTDGSGDASGSVSVSATATSGPGDSSPVPCGPGRGCVLVATTGTDGGRAAAVAFTELGFVSPVPPAPPPGVVLGVDGQRQLSLAWPGTGHALQPLAIAGIPAGPSLIAANPAGGWVVTYTPDRGAAYDQARYALATVDPDGTAHPFGPTFPSTEPITGLAVSPDGTRVALALMHATDGRPAELRVLPLPGHAAAPHIWTLANPANEAISLSWAPGGRQLSYIAGSQTGGGIAGPPSVLDTTGSGSTAPSTSSWSTGNTCQPTAAGWLPDGGFAVVQLCEGRTEYREVDPATGRPTAPAVAIPEVGCLAESLHLTSAGVLVGVCNHVYWIADGTVSLLPGNLSDAALPG